MPRRVLLRGGIREQSPGPSEPSRARRNAALAPSRLAAYEASEFVGQESFVTAREILALARGAGVGDRSLVLDLCCGTGGPALFPAWETGCRIVGVDRSSEAVGLARRAAAERALAGRSTFLVADARRLPLAAGFDAVLLLETMLAIRDKPGLPTEVRRVLTRGGRFGPTLEEGEPLSPVERRRLPDAEEVWLVTEREFHALLTAAGFRAQLVEDHTAAHAALALRLADAFEREGDAITAALGPVPFRKIILAHRQRAAWLETRRVRKLAIVAERAR